MWFMPAFGKEKPANCHACTANLLLVFQQSVCKSNVYVSIYVLIYMHILVYMYSFFFFKEYETSLNLRLSVGLVG